MHGPPRAHRIWGLQTWRETTEDSLAGSAAQKGAPPQKSGGAAEDLP